MKIKIFDTVILIRLLQETNFIEIFEEWDKNNEYKQVTTWECSREVKGEAKTKLEDLISRDIIKILDPVPIIELINLFSAFRSISFVDCSLLYYSRKINDSICLSDDYPLRKHCGKLNLDFHGTYGIYLKLLRDQTFPPNFVEERFKVFMDNARIFPN